MQAPNPYVDYLTDASFQGVNRLFVLSYENDTDRTVNTKYFFQLQKNLIIDGQNLFDQTAKNELKAYDNIQNIQIFKEIITLQVVYYNYLKNFKNIL